MEPVVYVSGCSSSVVPEDVDQWMSVLGPVESVELLIDVGEGSTPVMRVRFKRMETAMRAVQFLDGVVFKDCTVRITSPHFRRDAEVSDEALKRMVEEYDRSHGKKVAGRTALETLRESQGAKRAAVRQQQQAAFDASVKERYEQLQRDMRSVLPQNETLERVVLDNVERELAALGATASADPADALQAKRSQALASQELHVSVELGSVVLDMSSRARRCPAQLPGEGGSVSGGAWSAGDEEHFPHFVELVDAVAKGQDAVLNALAELNEAKRQKDECAKAVEGFLKEKTLMRSRGVFKGPPPPPPPGGAAVVEPPFTTTEPPAVFARRRAHRVVNSALLHEPAVPPSSVLRCAVVYGGPVARWAVEAVPDPLASTARWYRMVVEFWAPESALAFLQLTAALGDGDPTDDVARVEKVLRLVVGNPKAAPAAAAHDLRAIKGGAWVGHSDPPAPVAANLLGVGNPLPLLPRLSALGKGTTGLPPGALKRLSAIVGRMLDS